MFLSVCNKWFEVTCTHSVKKSEKRLILAEWHCTWQAKPGLKVNDQLVAYAPLHL